MKTFASVCSLVLIAGSASAASFQSGDLLVVRVGDGSAALSSAATAIFLDEYNLSGTLVQSIALPTAASGSAGALTLSGTATSEGFLQRSADGQFLTLGGYNLAPGTASPSGTTGNRTLGLVGSSGNVDTTTIIGTGFTGNIRSVWSDNGNRFWASTSSSGVGYVNGLGFTSATQLATTPSNTRVVTGIGGQLYVSSASGVYQGVSAIGTGLPTTLGQTTTLLNGFPTASGPSAYDFFLADRNASVAGLDTAWVADDRTSGAGGVQHWTFDGTTWSLSYTLQPSATTGARALTVDASGADPVLFVTTTDNKIMSFVDTGAEATPTTIVSGGPANSAFRGLDFAPGPIPEPSALSLIGLGIFVFLARRRQA